MNKTTKLSESAKKLIAESRKHQDEREKTYRGQALKLYPSICGRCSREFDNKNLSELTVHHKDHNHDNNPPDGSNWELLCLYCHDNEHQRYEEAQYGSMQENTSQNDQATFSPFAGLDQLIKQKK